MTRRLWGITGPSVVRVTACRPSGRGCGCGGGSILINNTDDDLRCRVTERTLREYFDLQPILYQAMKEAYSS